VGIGWKEIEMSLEKYRRKRDFNKTSEPDANEAGASGFRFVVQKHDASRLHYDFRLKLARTLKSWAVPKGIPFKRGEKRLAVQVEDHPLSYIDFEGTIPKGQYGGGTVMVWDRGTFEPLSKAPTKELAGGKLHFILHGQKLQGEWYLVRLRDDNQWLLIRGGEDLKPVSKKSDDTSVLSGKTMKQLSRSNQVWQSKPVEQLRQKNRAIPGRTIRDSLPNFVEPMQAKLVSSSPERGNWIYEIKFDGWRALALKGQSQARLVSRNEMDFSAKFPEIVASLENIDARDMIIDGEIVALDNKGRSSFQLLQAFDIGQERPPIIYYAFDLLQLNKEKLFDQPLIERKEKLKKLLENSTGFVRYSASFGSDPKPILQEARRVGIEGLIGKDTNSRYEAGRRSGAWIKLKLQMEQEFVIGGYTEPEGSRKYFGSIIVGFHKGEKLLCAGKVGTGFNQKLLRSLFSAFEEIAQDSCPFDNVPEKRNGRWGQGITISEMQRCHWIRPTLVCQVKFSEWTRDDRLRQPVFLGLRRDKRADEVIREKAS
jgi:bifunctional non-homologous end joining protein LigD